MRKKGTLAAVLLAVLLLCGCARLPAVADADAASERLAVFLQDFSHSAREDYDCVLQEVLTEDGETVYRMEAFWKTETGRYSLGLFRVSEDGTVVPE